MMPGTPANTFGYMVAGYVVILAALVLYGLSLVARFHHLEGQEKRMEEWESEEGTNKSGQAK